MLLNPKIGDKLRANSGGPLMSVRSIESDVYGEKTVVCHWIGEDAKPASGTFALSALAKP